MRVLVTGAAGFIGQHVSQLLNERGHSVLALDFRIPLIPLIWWDKVFKVDITEPIPAIPDLDAVIHLAAMANPRDCDAHPDQAFNANVNGTHQVLKMALESGAKKFIFSSSAHVYDIPPKYLPTDEMANLRLNNVYTTTKILGEELCRLYWSNYGLSYTTLRLFNVYGGGQAKGYFVPDKIDEAQRGGIDLRGSNVTKDWIYIDDVADAFVKAVSSPFVGALNIGTGIETNLGTVAGIIADAYKVELATFPVSVPTRMCADIRCAQTVLGWSPKVSLEEGLERTIKAYSDQKRPVLQKS